MEVLRFKNFSNIILEKSIGSEEIRKKWYSDLDKKVFYKLVNIDPTSIRKKEFSKPGKYTKWLINMYKKESKSEYFDFNDSFNSHLNFKLFIFSTGWYKSKVKKESFYLGGELNKTIENDILKFPTLRDFERHMYNYQDEYRKQTEDAKYDVVFSDDKIDILIPINFTASAETAKNTEWCSQSYGGYSMWNKIALLFRIIPKDNKYDKLKLTWNKDNKGWYLACSKYPEIRGSKNPFDKTNGIENWKIFKNEMDHKNDWDKWKENSIKIDETMNLLSEKAKETIKEYYNKNEKSKEV
jgi:hypothetical protein